MREIISGIFVSLLIINNKYRQRGRNRIFFPIVKSNLLKDILSDTLNPELLSLTLQEFTEITKEHILNSLSFWYIFNEKYNQNLLKLNRNKIQKPNEPIEKWQLIVDMKNHKCKVFSETNVYDEIKISNFLIYLMLLIKFTEFKKQPMAVEVLRKAIHNFNKNKIPKNIDLENARTSLSKIFNEAKKKHEWFERFYNSYIKYEQYKYKFHIEKLDLEIIGFDLNTDFFDGL